MSLPPHTATGLRVWVPLGSDAVDDDNAGPFCWAASLGNCRLEAFFPLDPSLPRHQHLASSFGAPLSSTEHGPPLEWSACPAVLLLGGLELRLAT